MSSPVLWWMTPAIAVQERVDAMQAAPRLTAEVLNLAEIYDFLLGPPGLPPEPLAEGVQPPMAAEDWSGMPAPRLRIGWEDFAFDHFVMGLSIVSARLAEALGLGPDQAQYLEVDCSACPVAVRDMGYRALNPLAFANPLDREPTGPGRFVDLETPAGPTFAWIRPPVARTRRRPALPGGTASCRPHPCSACRARGGRWRRRSSRAGWRTPGSTTSPFST